jgi:hypothetical protein
MLICAGVARPMDAMACAMLRNQTLYDPNYKSASPAAA